jgi:hypothetical protein
MSLALSVAVDTVVIGNQFRSRVARVLHSYPGHRHPAHIPIPLGQDPLAGQSVCLANPAVTPRLGLCERHFILLVLPSINVEVEVIGMDIALLLVLLLFLFFRLPIIISGPVPLPRVRDRIPERALLVVLMFRADCTPRFSARIQSE